MLAAALLLCNLPSLRIPKDRVFHRQHQLELLMLLSRRKTDIGPHMFWIHKLLLPSPTSISW